MKFIATITALAALLPFITLALAPSADADEVVVLDDSAPTGNYNTAAANDATAIEGIDFDESELNETASNEDIIAARAVTKQSDLKIELYKNRGCSGPRYDN
ncbi:MAG: hypothetical protein Q9226_003697 [Calogaya cf. arnoldii]